MTKSEFVDQIAAKTETSKADAARVVDAVIGTIEDTLKRGGEVNFTGFGKFHVSLRGARQGRIPSTVATIQMAAS